MLLAPNAVALDSNAVRAALRRDVDLLLLLAGQELCIPCVVLNEAVSGWQDLIGRSLRQQYEHRLAEALDRMVEFHELVREMAILRYSPDAQRLFVSLRAGRGSRGRNDLRIAAICIAHSVPLVTRNLSDFDDLPGLILRTW